MLNPPFDAGLRGDRAAAGAGPRRRQAEEGREEKGELIDCISWNFMARIKNIAAFKAGFRCNLIFYASISGIFLENL